MVRAGVDCSATKPEATSRLRRLAPGRQNARMNKRLRHHLAVVIAGVVVASAAPLAHAYVRAKTSDGIPIYRTGSCTSVTMYSNGFVEAQIMSRDEMAKSLAAAAHAWSPD